MEWFYSPRYFWSNGSVLSLKILRFSFDHIRHKALFVKDIKIIFPYISDSCSIYYLYLGHFKATTEHFLNDISLLKACSCLVKHKNKY